MVLGPRRQAGLLVTVFALILITALTLGSGDPAGHTPPAWCVFCSERATADALLNVILFVPLGVGLMIMYGSTLRVVTTSLTISVAIEAIQFVVPGRDAGVGDLITNSAGGLVGAVLLAHWKLLSAPSIRAAARLRLVWALLALAVLTTGSYLLLPELPPSTWYGQWTPRLGHLDVYRGNVLAARLGDRPLPSRRLEKTPEIRRSLIRGDVLRIRAIAGSSPEHLAPIFSIYDDQQREIYLLGARGDDFVVRYRNRGASLRLDAAELRVTGAFGLTGPGDTIYLRTAFEDRQVAIGVNAHATRDGFHTGDGWMLLGYSQNASPRAAQFLTLLWIAVWFVPLGYWAEGRIQRLLEAALLWAALLALPIAIPLRFLPVSLMVAPPLAALGGLFAARLLNRPLKRGGFDQTLPTSALRQRSILV